MCKLGVINQLKESQGKGKAPLGAGPVSQPPLPCLAAHAKQAACSACRASMPAPAPRPGPPPAVALPRGSLVSLPAHSYALVPTAPLERAGDAGDWAG